MTSNLFLLSSVLVLFTMLSASVLIDDAYGLVDTWSVDIIPTQNDYNDVFFDDVFFIDENNGWAAGGWFDPSLLFTIDGGESWESAAFIRCPDGPAVDLRDPKLSITPGGKLMLTSSPRTLRRL